MSGNRPGVTFTKVASLPPSAATPSAGSVASSRFTDRTARRVNHRVLGASFWEAAACLTAYPSLSNYAMQLAPATDGSDARVARGEVR